MNKRLLVAGFSLGAFAGAMLFAACSSDDANPAGGGGGSDASSADVVTPLGDSGNPSDGGADSGPVTCTVSPCAIQISVRYDFGCAVMSDRTVECWGSNDYGQLGSYSPDAAPYKPGVASPTALKVPGLTDVVQISTGFFHACALTGAGDVYCWGETTYGQLGQPTDGGGISNATPTKVAGITGKVAAVSAGGYFTCVRLADETITCWGQNESGQLGTGTFVDASVGYVPAFIAAATPVPGVSGVRELASGGRFNCALLGDGGLQCFGDNAEGQLGNGKIGDPSSTPTQVLGLTEPVASLGSAEAYNACAILASGGVRCWGDNASDQLGFTDAGALTTAAILPGATGVVEIGSGPLVTCFRQAAGTIACLGSAVNGDLGPLADASALPYPSPVNVPITDVVQLSVGHQHACALQKSGAVVCWGDNSGDAIGLEADASFSATPTTIHF